MISDIQKTANQQNALLGGVKTEEGKEISKYNSLKHGIYRQTVTEYEADHYSNILEELLEEWSPIGVVEQILVERIAMLYIKLLRVQKTETEFMKSQLDPRVVQDIISDWGTVVNEGYSPKVTPEGVEKLSTIYSRYETNIENRLYRAIHELQKLQTVRKSLQDPAVE